MFTVTRGDIAVKSVSAAYMLNDTTGYIRIKSFGERTLCGDVSSFANSQYSGCRSLGY